MIAVVLRLLYATLRVRLVDPADALGRSRRGEALVGAFWHDAILLMPLLVLRLGWPGRVRVLLGWHRDAEIAARAIGHLGVRSSRGSSTRGWLGGLRGMLAAHGRGEHLVIVPDGPRGPRHRAKRGAVQLARATGRPVVAFGAAARPARRLGSWDRMQVPMPFSRVVVVASEPIVVSRRADAGAVGEARAALEVALVRASGDAAAAIGVSAA